ncbi:unnamed protein product [Phytophthora fragariaefolia]|uniref:Unnamed protein product n=1 Tax=Phytophthora fragariaefolia TaxID=1490495 RepID=A0A9W6TLN0_9STRA|nr:unnamed protein product [Phytophthora fragariaefolia]
MLKWLRLLTLLLLAATALAASAPVEGEDPAVDSGDNAAPPPPYDCTGPSSTGDSFIDYDHLVHCNPLLQGSPVLGKTALVLCLVLLLYLLSSTADEFFCPVLQAIVEKYRIPAHVAGVTFLSFGNGSPDVFSNIAAFATPTPSIGVTAILGGGLLVTTVITACVGLVSDGQEQLIPRTFLRDVVFYFIAVLYLGLVFFDGKVGLLEAVGFLCIYFVYVLVVFSDKQLAACCVPSKASVEDSIYAVLDDDDDLEFWSSTASEKSTAGSPVSFPARTEQPQLQQQQKRRPYLKSQTIPVYDTFARSHIFSDSEQSEPSPRFLDRMLYRKSSVPTPRSKPHLCDDLGVIGRNEGQSLLEVTDVHLKRPSSMCVGSMQESLRRIRRQRRRRKTAWESLETSAHFGASARRWTRGYHALSDIDEVAPGLEGGREEMGMEMENEISNEEVTRKEEEATAQAAEEEQLAKEAIMAVSAFDRVKVQAKRWRRLLIRSGRCLYSAFDRFVWNPFEVLTVFIRRLTIPLVDEDTWDKNLVVVCPPFAMLVFGVSVFSFSIEDPVFLMTVVVVGGMFSAIIEYSASPLAPPEGWMLAPFIYVAFVMSVIWIMNIANEVLAVLETLGELFGISSSVLGVLAWGNSIGDLVSNMAIARDGFPTMAFAGCFAGPMFNLLIGIGLSLTIAILSRGPIFLGEPTPLVYLGFGYLLLSLLLNIGMASCDVVFLIAQIYCCRNSSIAINPATANLIYCYGDILSPDMPFNPSMLRFGRTISFLWRCSWLRLCNTGLCLSERLPIKNCHYRKEVEAITTGNTLATTGSTHQSKGVRLATMTDKASGRLKLFVDKVYCDQSSEAISASYSPSRALLGLPQLKRGLAVMTGAQSCPTMEIMYDQDKQINISTIADTLQCVKDTVEKWNFINPTADAHPFHWPLVHVQCGDTVDTIRTNELMDVSGTRAADTITQVCYVACTLGDYLIDHSTRESRVL